MSKTSAEPMAKDGRDEQDGKSGKPPEPPGPSRKNRLVPWIVLGVLIVGVLAFMPYLHQLLTHETTDDAFIEGHVVQISPKVAGQVKKVYVSDNQMVKEGDLLVEIDDADYRAEVSHAAAALRQAREKERSSKINVDLTQTTTRAAVQQASSVVDEAQSGIGMAASSVEEDRAAVQQAIAAAETARAQVASARDRLAQAKSQVQEAERNYLQAQSQIKAAQADADRTHADMERYRQLFRQDAVSKQQWDNALAAARVAEAQLQSAREKAAAVRAQVAEIAAQEASASDGVRMAETQLLQSQGHVIEAQAKVAEAEARVSQARASEGEARGRLASANSAPQQVAFSKAQVSGAAADLAAAAAQLETARLQLSYTRIYAPQSGRIAQKAVEPGQVVGAGQALFAIVNPDVWVVANFKETQLTRMRPGQHVDVKIEAYPKQLFKGHVDTIQAGTGARFSMLPPENATGNFVKVVQRVPVKIVFDEKLDSTLVIGPGMSVVPSVQVP